jgi:FG-GAP-like repeat
MGGAQGNVFQRWDWLSATDVPGWHIAATADLDRDGKLDLVWQNDIGRQVVAWYLDGPQGNVVREWAWLSSEATPGWSVVGISDVNHDGTPDLLWQNDEWEDDMTRHLEVWYMSGSLGNVLQSRDWLPGLDWWTPPDGYRVVGTADFDRDGFLDLVFQDNVSGQASWSTTDQERPGDDCSPGRERCLHLLVPRAGA